LRGVRKKLWFLGVVGYASRTLQPLGDLPMLHIHRFFLTAIVFGSVLLEEA